MLPISSDVKHKIITPVTAILIIINVIVFLFSTFLPGDFFAQLLIKSGYSLNPFTNLQSFIVTSIVSLFLHANIFHIFFNMLYLYVFGAPVEIKVGKIAFLVLYFQSGVTGFLFYYLFANSNLPVIGASGAISGLIVAYLFFFPKSKIFSFWLIFWIIRFIYVPAWIFIGSWIISQMISLMLIQKSEIAYQAHLGGIIFGILFYVFYKKLLIKKNANL